MSILVWDTLCLIGGIYETVDCSGRFSPICGRNVNLWRKLLPSRTVRTCKEPVRGEITVYTDLPNNITTLLADRYEEEKNVKVTVMPLTEEQMAQRSASNVADTSGDLVLTSEE